MNIGDDEREFLLGMRALTVNDRGEEVFVGLTRQESVEFLGLSRDNEAGKLRPTAAERFAHLKEKHEKARLNVVDGKAPLHPAPPPR